MTGSLVLPSGPLHGDLALRALAVGLVLVVIEASSPRRIAQRAFGFAGLAASVAGGLAATRASPWIVVAGLACVAGETRAGVHPLGRWFVPFGVVSLLGVWASVPDTEPAVAAIAVAVPFGVARVARGLPTGRIGTMVMMLMVVGAIWSGSAGRGWAWGAVGALGVVAAAPVVSGFGVELPKRAIPPLLGFHLAAAATPRVLLGRSAALAALGSAVVLCGSVGGVRLVTRRAGVGPGFRPP